MQFTTLNQENNSYQLFANYQTKLIDSQLIDQINHLKNRIIIIASEQDLLVGLACLKPVLANPHYLKLEYLNVANDYQNQKIGSNLLQHCKMIARQNNSYGILASFNEKKLLNFFIKNQAQLIDETSLNQKNTYQIVIDKLLPFTILASGSPRRQELLKRLIPNFTISLGHEPQIEKKEPATYVQKLALAKATSIKSNNVSETLIIGADTIVALNQQILEKPQNKQEALTMLTSLENHTHAVYTGVAFVYQYKQQIITKTFYEKTEVTFNHLTQKEIIDYINNENVYDKAGAYSIQGIAGKFISKINGDYYNVVGLPLAKTYQELKHFLKININ